MPLSNHQRQLVIKATKLPSNSPMLKRIEDFLLVSNSTLDKRSGAEFMKLAQMAYHTLQLQGSGRAL